jgi:hypothetical protein
MRARSTIGETTKASKRTLCDGTGELLAGDNYGAVSGESANGRPSVSALF